MSETTCRPGVMLTEQKNTLIIWHQCACNPAEYLIDQLFLSPARINNNTTKEQNRRDRGTFGASGFLNPHAAMPDAQCSEDGYDTKTISHFMVLSLAPA